MKRFETHYGEIESSEGDYFVSGRNVGTEPIRVGDSLNGLTVKAIEAYGHRLDECHPGMTARLTLPRRREVQDGRYDFPLTLRDE